MEEFIGVLIIIYFILIPCVYVTAWQDIEDSECSFVKWYFIKSDSVNYLGFAIFLILGLGSFLYTLLWYFMYAIVVPFFWLFEFLFLNKDCSNVVCQELVDKELEREGLKQLKLEAQDLNDFIEILTYESYLRALNSSFDK